MPRWTMTLDDRFFAKVHITDQCWHWRGSQNGRGYGQIAVDGRPYKVHRLIYEKTVAALSPDLEIDHLCRNKLCVRPSHLEAVSKREHRLRESVFVIANGVKTHCPSGHAYDVANTRITSQGTRICRACHRATAHAARDRKRYLAEGLV